MNPTIEAEPAVAPRRQFNMVQLTLRVAAVVLAAAGFWVSAQLMKISFDANATSALLDMTCGTGNTDCLSVLRSSRALVTDDKNNGIPWSVIGVAYFAAITLWYLFVGFPSRDRWYWHVGVTLVIGAGAIVSANLLGVMAFELHRWCVGCTITHIINFGLLLVTLVGMFLSRAKQPVAHPSFALGGATALLSLISFIWIVNSAQLLSMQLQFEQLKDAHTNVIKDPEYVLWRYERRPVVDVPVADEDIIAGNLKAPNTIVVFADLQCPNCRTVHKLAVQLAERHPDVVRVAMRYFPNSSECNPKYKTILHPAACEAARWSIAAMQSGEHEKAIEFIDELFAMQADLDTRPFAEVAARVGLDAAALARLADGDAVKQRLNEDIEVGGKAGVTATPRVLLNGRIVDHWNNLAAWSRLLNIPEDATSQPVGEGD